jgi:hypothetical protein
MEVSGQLRALAALPPEHIGYKAGWIPEPVCLDTAVAKRKINASTKYRTFVQQ